MNKYQQMSLLDLLEKEKEELLEIEENEEVIFNALYEKEDDIPYYTERIASATSRLNEIRSDIRQYFKHNLIVPLGGEF